jgi:heptose-I-phosphate ethanolaminephosphotransferase
VASERKTLAVVHLMGTHFIYEKRYPPDGEVFRSTDDLGAARATTAQALGVINHYDNAVAYQDRILGGILERLNQSGLDGVLVYFSDHGEEVYDTDDFHGHSEDRATPSMREVPLVVGFSESYRRTQRAHFDCLKANEDAPISTFQVTPTVTTLLGFQPWQDTPVHSR